MIGARIKIDEITPFLKAARKRCSNLKPLMARYYGETFAEVMRNFRQQGSFGDILSDNASNVFKAWPSLGKLQAANRRARGTGTALLQDSGALRASIGTIRKVTATEMELGTYLVYGAMMHFGTKGLPGGVLRPKSSKYLSLPFPGVKHKPREYENTFVVKHVMFQKLPSGGIIPLFALRSFVVIPARPYMTISLDTVDRFCMYAANYAVGETI